MITLPVKLLATNLDFMPDLDSNLPSGSVRTFYRLSACDRILSLEGIGRNGSYVKIFTDFETPEPISLLVPASDTKATLKNLENSYYLQLLQELAAIRLLTKCAPDDPQTLDSNLIPAFAGDESEFVAPKIPDKFELEVNSQEFEDACARSIDFGDYGNRTMGDRAALITIDNNSLSIYATALNAPNYYYAQKVAVKNCNLTCDIALLGTDLELLAQTKSNSKELFLAINDNVCSLTKQRLVSVNQQSIDRFSNLKPIVKAFDSFTALTPLINVRVSSKRFLEALTAQQPKTSPNKFVRLNFKHSELNVSKAADLLTREVSLVPYLDSNPETCLSFTTSSAAALKTIKSLDRAISKSKLSEPLQIDICEREGKYAAKFHVRGLSDTVVCSLNLEK